MTRMLVDAAQFTPAQAAALSNVSVELQRDWRKRGFLPAHGGKHARFDPFQVATLIVARVLASHDAGPGYAVAIAERVARQIICLALLDRSDRIEVIGPRDAVERYRDKLGLDATEIMSIARVSEIGRFLVSWPEGSDEITGDLVAAFDAAKAKSALVLDLETIGKELAAAVDVPLFVVTLCSR